MPLNRVGKVKQESLWIRVLELKGEDAKSDELPNYIPGLLLIPLGKDAGFIFRYIDFAFFGILLYVFGSILYLIDSLYLWPRIGLTSQYSKWFNFGGCVLYIVDAIVAILDWYTQYKRMSVYNIVLSPAGTEFNYEDCNAKSLYLYFMNNLFFLSAAVIYMIQAMWSRYPTTDQTGCYNSFCGHFWINFAASMGYVLSAQYSIYEYKEEQRLQQAAGLASLHLFSLDPSRLDWWFWGDAFFATGSYITLFMAFQDNFIYYGRDLDGAQYFVSNMLYLLSSICYQWGYSVYIQNLRTELMNGIKKSEWEIKSNLDMSVYAHLLGDDTSSIGHLDIKNYF